MYVLSVVTTLMYYMSIPRNGLTLDLCQQQWGSHYYIVLRLFSIGELYSVIWYIHIMQLYCMLNDLNILQISQDNDSG